MAIVDAIIVFSFLSKNYSQCNQKRRRYMDKPILLRFYSSDIALLTVNCIYPYLLKVQYFFTFISRRYRFALLCTGTFIVGSTPLFVYFFTSHDVTGIYTIY